MKQGKTEKAVFAKLSTEKVELAQHEVELAMVQDILKDYEIMQGQLKSIINIASRRAYNFDEVDKYC